MTVIAWDGKVLAADRMSTVGGTPIPHAGPKVHRLRAPNGKVALVGFSGNSAYAWAYLAWMRGGEEPQLKQGEDLKFSIILIEWPRWVWYRSDTANRWDLFGAMSSWAIGSGCDYALGAMEHGASAREAVRIASRLDNQCGMGVDVVRF
jgi:ATP-dependent protease HslVU (ClpYQ) peptidase subunit